MPEVRVFPIPGVIRITPHTVQVTQRQPDKNGRLPKAFTFTLNGMKNFRLAVQFGQLDHSPNFINLIQSLPLSIDPLTERLSFLQKTIHYLCRIYYFLLKIDVARYILQVIPESINSPPNFRFCQM